MNKTLLRWLLGLTLLAAVAAAVTFRDRFDAAALENWVNSAGAAGPLLFMAIYALATVLFLPGSVITLVGGALKDRKFNRTIQTKRPLRAPVNPIFMIVQHLFCKSLQAIPLG